MSAEAYAQCKMQNTLLIIYETLFLSFHLYFYRSPEQICIDHDPHKVVFKPAIPAPKAKVVAKKINVHHFANSNFEEYVNNIFESVDSSSIN